MWPRTHNIYATLLSSDWMMSHVNNMLRFSSNTLSQYSPEHPHYRTHHSEICYYSSVKHLFRLTSYRVITFPPIMSTLQKCAASSLCLSNLVWLLSGCNENGCISRQTEQEIFFFFFFWRSRRRNETKAHLWMIVTFQWFLSEMECLIKLNSLAEGSG